VPTSSFIIKGSKFISSPKQNGWAIIQLTDSPGEIVDCHFEKKEDVDDDDQVEQRLRWTSRDRAVALRGGLSDVKIANTTFINLYHEAGGAAIHYEDAGDNQLLNCTFSENQGMNGGAISVSETKALRLTGCLFYRNSAVNWKPTPINLIKDQNRYRGGAIYVDNTHSHQIVLL
jgi:hypothetical protein